MYYIYNVLIEIRRIINIYQHVYIDTAATGRSPPDSGMWSTKRLRSCWPHAEGTKKTVDGGEILHQLMVLSCFIPLVEHVELKP